MVVRPHFDKEKLHADLDRVAGATPIKPVPIPPPRPPRQIGRFLYLPVEIAARELPSKARLAGEMAARGFQVVLAATWNLMSENAFCLPPGLFLFKTLNTFDAQNMALLQEAGHRIAVLSEEAFSLLPESWLYRAEMCDAALSAVDLICAHGDKSAEALRALAGDKVRVTGNPRANTEAIVGGSEILVCMMAGNINGYLPFDQYMRATFKALGKTDGDVLKLMHEQIEHECTQFPLMFEIYETLTTMFGERVKLRPHPSENKTIYDGSTDSRPFSEALRSAAVIVFVSGCGTGLEAYLAGVPSVRVGTGGHGVSKNLGTPCTTAAQVATAVESLLATPHLEGSLEGHFAPVTLAEVLDAHQQQHSRAVIADIEKIWKARAKPFKPVGFHLNKFPVTSSDVMEGLVGRPVRRLGWNTWLVR